MHIGLSFLAAGVSVSVDSKATQPGRNEPVTGCITKVRACDVEHVLATHTACASKPTAANHVHSLSYLQAVLNPYKMTQAGLFSIL